VYASNCMNEYFGCVLICVCEKKKKKKKAQNQSREDEVADVRALTERYR